MYLWQPEIGVGKERKFIDTLNNFLGFSCEPKPHNKRLFGVEQHKLLVDFLPYPIYLMMDVCIGVSFIYDFIFILNDDSHTWDRVPL